MIVDASASKAINFKFFATLTKKLFMIQVLFLCCDPILNLPERSSRDKLCQTNQPVQNAAITQRMRSSGSCHEKACEKRVFSRSGHLRRSPF